MARLVFSLLFLTLAVTIACAQQYDLVLEGGRVMEPETGLDAVRNVAVCDGKIVRISSHVLIGKRVIHAHSLVVTPGFIDLHQHGQDLESQRLKALDGVTTALELEIGAPDVAQFLKAKQGHRAENPATGGWSAGNASRARAVARVPLEVAQQPRNLFDAERTLTSGPCKTCGNPHGNGRCPVADLNRIQELETALLTSHFGAHSGSLKRGVQPYSSH